MDFTTVAPRLAHIDFGVFRAGSIRRLLYRFALAAVAASALNLPFHVEPVHADLYDTPVLVAGGNVEEWSVGAGLLY